MGQGLLVEINANLESQVLKLREGTIMDATIIEAPSSTKNRAGERDPEMHQTKKGNQWHFGMKAHIGVDADTGLVPFPFEYALYRISASPVVIAAQSGIQS